ncbi:hypothetical protein RDI58_014857 [Solanum bulbocastanum]|uniref:Uncharacterized protein n=1 Tax=Solanum bulbocastanum TaxID=147425 RepID=A0AAN8TJE8_SOLBU
MQLSSLPDGEDNNYKGVGFARAGGSGIPALHVRDPIQSAHWQELAPNGRFMFSKILGLRFGVTRSHGKR